MTPAQVQSRLRFTARQLSAESVQWPRAAARRLALSHAALQLAVAARECRPGISEVALDGARALLDAGLDAIVAAAVERTFTKAKQR